MLTISKLEDPLPALEDWGVQSLYKLQELTSNDNGKYDDHAFILKKMAKSLLLNFLELVGIMSYSPIDVGTMLLIMNTI
jgi:mediator of RNA polymerase II transcription subunit 7